MALVEVHLHSNVARRVGVASLDRLARDAGVATPEVRVEERGSTVTTFVACDFHSAGLLHAILMNFARSEDESAELRAACASDATAVRRAIDFLREQER